MRANLLICKLFSSYYEENNDSNLLMASMPPVPFSAKTGKPGPGSQQGKWRPMGSE